MRDPLSETAELDDLFRAVKTQLADTQSVAPQVRQRIAMLPMRPARGWRHGVWMVAAVVLVGLSLWRYSRPGPGPTAGGNQTWQSTAELQVDGADVTIHLAALVARRAVLVVWSCPDDTRFLLHADQADRKYHCYTLPLTQQPRGRRATAQLFVAAEGIHPVLEAPMIALTTPRHASLMFSVSPQLASATTLDQCLHFAGPASPAGLCVNDIYSALQKHPH